MTVVHMSEKGQIIVPKPSRKRLGLVKGSAFLFTETKDGHLVFRPVRKPKKALLDHLLGLKGLEIPERFHGWRPRI